MLPPEVIRRVPIATEDNASGSYYDAPALDGTRPETYWINLRDMRAVELGYYEDDPFGDLGCLQDELFRAVRLVVDASLHHKRWTREQMRAAQGDAFDVRNFNAIVLNQGAMPLRLLADRVDAANRRCETGSRSEALLPVSMTYRFGRRLDH